MHKLVKWESVQEMTTDQLYTAKKYTEEHFGSYVWILLKNLHTKYGVYFEFDTDSDMKEDHYIGIVYERNGMVHSYFITDLYETQPKSLVGELQVIETCLQKKRGLSCTVNQERHVLFTGQQVKY